MLFDVDTRPRCEKCGAIGNIYATIFRDQKYVLIGCCEGCVIKHVLGDDEFERLVKEKLAEFGPTTIQIIDENGVIKEEPLFHHHAPGTFVPYDFSAPSRWWEFWK